MSALKFCINCAHIGTNSSHNWELYKCFAPENLISTNNNLVTGEEQCSYHFMYATLARKEFTIPSCGQSAIWFKQATPKAIPGFGPMPTFPSGKKQASIDVSLLDDGTTPEQAAENSAKAAAALAAIRESRKANK